MLLGEAQSMVKKNCGPKYLAISVQCGTSQTGNLCLEAFYWTGTNFSQILTRIQWLLPPPCSTGTILNPPFSFPRHFLTINPLPSQLNHCICVLEDSTAGIIYHLLIYKFPQQNLVNHNTWRHRLCTYSTDTTVECSKLWTS
jgi:hypothetical protein